MDWLIALIVSVLAALIIASIVLMMRHREKMRAAAREADSLNMLSNDTRRAFWISSADSRDSADSAPSSDGGDGGSD